MAKKVRASRSRSAAKTSILRKIARLLEVPDAPLAGKRVPNIALPANVVCFFHSRFSEMNRPPEGRAFHHRYVLAIALETAATVCVDDRAITLNPGEGLLIMPFQFHNYVNPDGEKITWLFITFEIADGASLECLRHHSFALSTQVSRLLADLLRSYMSPGEDEVSIILLSLILARIRQSDLLKHGARDLTVVPNIFLQINQIAQGDGRMPSVDEIAASLGISPSHLRARFRASCGVSVGRHLRKLRLAKACDMLRLSKVRVGEIAEMCGFNSVFSFSRSFRKTYGISPLYYRRNNKATTGAKR